MCVCECSGVGTFGCEAHRLNEFFFDGFSSLDFHQAKRENKIKEREVSFSKWFVSAAFLFIALHCAFFYIFSSPFSFLLIHGQGNEQSSGQQPGQGGKKDQKVRSCAPSTSHGTFFFFLFIFLHSHCLLATGKEEMGTTGRSHSCWQKEA